MLKYSCYIDNVLRPVVILFNVKIIVKTLCTKTNNNAPAHTCTACLTDNFLEANIIQVLGRLRPKKSLGLIWDKLGRQAVQKNWSSTSTAKER